MQNEYDLGLQTTHGVRFQNQKQTVETVEKPKEIKKNYCPLKRGTCSKTCCLNNDGNCGMFNGATVRTGGFCPVVNGTCKDRCVMNDNGHCILLQVKGEQDNE